MKNNKFLITIYAMVVTAIISVAVVSCKKETQGNLMNNKNELVQTFNPREIEDMNAYLKGFKQKMQSATKGDDEALSLEEAAWHLSSLANFEFGHANVECDDVRFDTLYAQVNITNGEILLTDLASVYEKTSTSIDKFYKNLALDNKHFRFIDVSIGENGQVLFSLMTTFNNNSKNLGDHCWYFLNEFDALMSCDTLFNLSTYPFYTTGTTELQRILNLIISNPPVANSDYYFITSTTTFFYYRDHIDQYGSPCYMNSRIFASITVNDDLKDMMCYLLDSYLALGRDNCPMDEYLLSWTVSRCYYEAPFYGEHFSKQYHELSVKYGTMHLREPEPGGGNY